MQALIAAIHYGNMSCNSTETHLTDCPYSGIRYCSHHNDDGAVCDTRISKLAKKMHVMIMVTAAMVVVVTA